MGQFGVDPARLGLVDPGGALIGVVCFKESGSTYPLGSAVPARLRGADPETSFGGRRLSADPVQ
ncbi:hypothetical protein ACFY05_14710 [Microtetraspora fusca]|uniref:Uncharacterized protein n=1 Tax=Microtetraspora fusca TaxID=1997 RepID=A0ABW6V471_MICFU